MPVTKTCVICGTEFQAIPSWGQTRATCSKECRYKLVSQRLSNKETRYCKQCGKPFTAAPSHYKILCSKFCHHVYMSKLFSGEGNPYWKETKALKRRSCRSLRRRILERDRVCQHCGSESDLEVHHIDSNPANNSGENVILLCKFCHAKSHKLAGESELVGLILSERENNHRQSRFCLVCGATFQPKKRKQITCSPQCGRIQSGRTRSL